MKDITVWAINKIKMCQLRIFEAYDDDIPNWRKIRANERAIEHYLKNKSTGEKVEFLSVVNWYNNNCIEALKKLGWKVHTCNKEKEVLCNDTNS